MQSAEGCQRVSCMQTILAASWIACLFLNYKAFDLAASLRIVKASWKSLAMMALIEVHYG